MRFWNLQSNHSNFLKKKLNKKIATKKLYGEMSMEALGEFWRVYEFVTLINT